MMKGTFRTILFSLFFLVLSSLIVVMRCTSGYHIFMARIDFQVKLGNTETRSTDDLPQVS